jgi:hypothetical protein
MKTSENLQIPSQPGKTNATTRWTAGPVISVHERKGFNRDGEEMKSLNLKIYVLEVFPPVELRGLMQQPSPDIVDHLSHRGIDTCHLDKRDVSFLAYVSMPIVPEESAVMVNLVSEQRENGGIYKHEIEIPKQMLYIRESPLDTVLDSLNNAFHRYNWYPPY